MGTVAVLSLLVALGLAVVVVRRDVRPGSDPVPAGTGQDDWSPLHVELDGPDAMTAASRWSRSSASRCGWTGPA